MAKTLFILGNNDHFFLESDLDAWVEANKEWLPNFDNSEIYNFSHSITRDSYSARLHIFFSPQSDRCARCDEEGVVEHREVCVHEWYEPYDLKVVELWEEGA